ncbi:MAG: hypothetical protein JWL95_2764, partial [Gemmatimonadetes bacterium]|nr:hypothetical protein [Gemmatimonadota bacterium]
AVIGLYAIGFTGIAVSFALLHRHALAEREALALTELERFDTSATLRRWMRVSLVGTAILLWCGALLTIPDHMRARDGVYQAVARGGSAIVLAISLSQLVVKRALARQRAALIARLGAEEASQSTVLLG